MTDYTTMTNEELSAEIARRLFGLVPCEGDHSKRRVPYVRSLTGVSVCAPRKPYADDHNAAMGLVVPKMRARGWRFSLDDWHGQARATFWRAANDDAIVKKATVAFSEEPSGICMAALVTLDAEEAA